MGVQRARQAAVLSADGTMMTCRDCGRELPLAAFPRHKNYVTGHANNCIRCKNLTQLYGMTQADYERMSQEQGGRCACCGGPGDNRSDWRKHPLHIDHDHATGKVRALLCGTCNLLLAWLEPDPSRAEKALAYLKKHRGAN
jgi:hypothetical protein